MPSLSRITATFFIDLINRLGIRPPPDEAFLISNVVTPVSIVDSGVTLQSINTTQTLDTAFTNGIVVGPAAGAVLADIGAQVDGTYAILMLIGQDNTVASSDFLFGRRNAANAAYIWSQLMEITTTGGGLTALSMTVKLSLNERFRVEAFSANAAHVQASLFLQKLS